MTLTDRRHVRRRRTALAAAAGAAFVLGVSLGAGAGDDAPLSVREVRDIAATDGGAADGTGTGTAGRTDTASGGGTTGSGTTDSGTTDSGTTGGDAADSGAVVRVVTPTPTPTAAPEPVDRLTLQQQVGRLVVLRFQGTSAPAYVRRALHNGQAAGAILFADNITSPTQLRSLTRTLRRSGAAKSAGGATPIVATDQEGGAIRRIPWAPPANAQPSQVPGRDALAAARALRAAGLNVSFSPVADVPAGAGSVMRSRAFSGDIARATRAAIGGWLTGGVAPTAKHFPGIGAATVNTDFGVATIANAPTDADLAPFKAAIAAKVPLIMSAHARYPRLDATHIASQSSKILDDLLRDRLHYDGVVITDSIEAKAAQATGSLEQIALRSIRAGNDIVLTTGQGSWIRVYRALYSEARSSRAFRNRVRESAARVLMLQGRLK